MSNSTSSNMNQQQRDGNEDAFPEVRWNGCLGWVNLTATDIVFEDAKLGVTLKWNQGTLVEERIEPSASSIDLTFDMYGIKEKVSFQFTSLAEIVRFRHCVAVRRGEAAEAGASDAGSTSTAASELTPMPTPEPTAAAAKPSAALTRNEMMMMLDDPSGSLHSFNTFYYDEAESCQSFALSLGGNHESGPFSSNQSFAMSIGTATNHGGDDLDHPFASSSKQATTAPSESEAKRLAVFAGKQRHPWRGISMRNLGASSQPPYFRVIADNPSRLYPKTEEEKEEEARPQPPPPLPEDEEISISASTTTGASTLTCSIAPPPPRSPNKPPALPSASHTRGMYLTPAKMAKQQEVGEGLPSLADALMAPSTNVPTPFESEQHTEEDDAISTPRCSNVKIPAQMEVVAPGAVSVKTMAPKTKLDFDHHTAAAAKQPGASSVSTPVPKTKLDQDHHASHSNLPDDAKPGARAAKAPARKTKLDHDQHRSIANKPRPGAITVPTKSKMDLTMSSCITDVSELSSPAPAGVGSVRHGRSNNNNNYKATSSKRRSTTTEPDALALDSTTHHSTTSSSTFLTATVDVDSFASRRRRRRSGEPQRQTGGDVLAALKQSRMRVAQDLVSIKEASSGSGSGRRRASQQKSLHQTESEDPVKDQEAGSDRSFKSEEEHTESTARGDISSSSTRSSSNSDNSSTESYGRRGNLIEAVLVEEGSSSLRSSQRPKAVASAVDVVNESSNKRRMYMAMACGWALVIVVVVIVVSLTTAGVIGGGSGGGSGGSDSDADVAAGSFVLTPEEHYAFLAAELPPVEGDDDEMSPQSLAMNWMAYEDSLSKRLIRDEELGRLQQRYALAVFYFSMTQGQNQWSYCEPPETGESAACVHPVLEAYHMEGIHFDQSMSEPSFRWLSYVDACRWAGVTCTDGVHVSHLELAGYDLKGSLPVELGYLSTLEVLDLQLNSLEGTLPEEWGTLATQHGTALQTIRLGRNELTGSIPEDWCQFSSLTTLSLSANELTGSLPSCLSDLTSLENLSVIHNNLSGDIPQSLADLPNLERLHLAGNQFHGEVPAGFCAAGRPFQASADCANAASANYVECSCCTACCDGDGDLDECTEQFMAAIEGAP